MVSAEVPVATGGPLALSAKGGLLASPARMPLLSLTRACLVVGQSVGSAGWLGALATLQQSIVGRVMGAVEAGWGYPGERSCSGPSLRVSMGSRAKTVQMQALAMHCVQAAVIEWPS